MRKPIPQICPSRRHWNIFVLLYDHDMWRLSIVLTRNTRSNVLSKNKTNMNSTQFALGDIGPFGFPWQNLARLCYTLRPWCNVITKTSAIRESINLMFPSDLIILFLFCQPLIAAMCFDEIVKVSEQQSLQRMYSLCIYNLLMWLVWGRPVPLG